MLLSDLSDDERARHEAWRNEYQARQRSERQAKIRHYEGLLTSIGAEIAAATEALADLNRRAVRDALRDLLARHPRLDRVSVNLSTAYNDDTYFFGATGLWLDDTYVSADISDGPSYEPFHGFYARSGSSRASGFRMGMREEHLLRDGVVWNANGGAFGPTSSEQIAALEREAYGDLYDVAADAVATLRAFVPLGLHFWADGFGYGAIVEATRAEMRILPQHYHEEHGLGPFDAEWFTGVAREAGIPLGSVTSAYASDPERAPHVAVRLARTPDLTYVEQALIGVLVEEATAPLVVPGSLYYPDFGARTAFGEVEALIVGPFEIPLRRPGYGPLAPDEAALDALAAEPARPFGDGRTLAFTPEVREAAQAWLAVLHGLEARFGRRRLVRFFAPRS